MHLGALQSLRIFVPSRQSKRRSLNHPVARNVYPICPRQVLRPGRPQVTVRAEEAKGNGRLSQTPPLDFEELTDLIRMVSDSDIIDFEIENHGVNLTLKKAEALEERVQVIPGAMMPSPPTPTYTMPQPSVPEPPSPAPAPATPSTPAPEKKEESSDATPDGLQITSPMSGTYYAAPAPGEPPFATEGDKVTTGQTVCIIEAMKLMNEIEAEVSGEVIKILAQNGQSITAGQALMIVKPI